ncbi:hypothetical protein OIU79_015578 [Salix purpurea]|uniref:Uncharacterized protein n=1 Tax=Salix purpurea TaxID=77065 RepID=A0A9Q0SQD5_SALPP|nr:hypothetical protein OIU79_015578 [Salix purpurea]
MVFEETEAKSEHSLLFEEVSLDNINQNCATKKESRLIPVEAEQEVVAGGNWQEGGGPEIEPQAIFLVFGAVKKSIRQVRACYTAFV